MNLDLPLSLYPTKTMYVTLWGIPSFIFYIAFKFHDIELMNTFTYFILCLGFITLISAVLITFTNRPIVTIYPDRLVLFRLFKRNFQNIIYFDDIISMKLDYSISRYFKTLSIYLYLKKGCNEIYPVENLKIIDGGNDLKLTEQQIFDLIEQTKQGNTTLILPPDNTKIGILANIFIYFFFVILALKAINKELGLL